MPSQKDILKVIATYPDGVGIGQLAGELDTQTSALTKTLSDLKKKGYISHEGEIYQVTNTGAAYLEQGETAGKAATPSVSELPGDFDVFRQLGESVGVRGDFLEAVTRHIFRLDYRNITIVFNELSSLALRPDVVVRWAKLWASHLGVPAPTQVAGPLPSTGTGIPADKVERWSVEGGRPVPDEEGEYTFARAMKVAQLERQATASGGSEELKELRASIEALKDQRYLDLIGGQQRQIEGLTASITNLKETVVELRRPVTGRSEMDIIYEVADKGFTEVASLRKDVKDYFKDQALPPAKTAEQREERKDKYRKAIKDDQDIEEIGRRLFMGEKPPEAEAAVVVRPRAAVPSPNESSAAMDFTSPPPGS